MVLARVIRWAMNAVGLMPSLRRVPTVDCMVSHAPEPLLGAWSEADVALAHASLGAAFLTVVLGRHERVPEHRRMRSSGMSSPNFW